MLLTLVLPLAALWLGVSDPVEGLPAVGEVVAESFGAFVAPDTASVAPERLHRGDRVQVIDANERTGWLTITPPAVAFSWIEANAIEIGENREARVSTERAQVRAGVPNARLPGPSRAALERGATVKLIDRPPLTVSDQLPVKTWLAIEPTAGEVRYLRTDGLRILAKEPAAEIAVSYQPAETPADAIPGLPPALAAELAQAEREHRATLALPVENWRLDTVRKRYELILKSVTDSDQKSMIQERLTRIAGQDAAGRTARQFETLLMRSRQRDREVENIRRRLAAVEQPRRQPYVAEGLLQATSRRIDGRRVFALIGTQGAPVAYLDVPPGLDTRPILAKRAGVRGAVHYNEALGARLIAVKELEPLE